MAGPRGVSPSWGRGQGLGECQDHMTMLNTTSPPAVTTRSTMLVASLSKNAWFMASVVVGVASVDL